MSAFGETGADGLSPPVGGGRGLPGRKAQAIKRFRRSEQ